jgi:RNA polymerase sigma-70 factor, ECF subfamily
MTALAARFVERADSAAAGLDRAALEEALAGILASARERWPDIAFDDVAAVTTLAERWVPDGEAATLRFPPFAADVVFAQACLAGDAEALRGFHRDMFGRAHAVLARLKLGRADFDDVIQDVKTKLLVGERPRLAQFEGQGPLAHWVASVAGREALSLLRRRTPSESLDDAGDLVAADVLDPEHAVLHARHAADFKRAFQASVLELPPRDRAVLRALLVDERSVNEIAAFYQIHRVTASRWISGIRETLLRETRRRLQETLQLDPESLDSAVRIVAGQFDVSLHRILSS